MNIILLEDNSIIGKVFIKRDVYIDIDKKYTADVLELLKYFLIKDRGKTLKLELP